MKPYIFIILVGAPLALTCCTSTGPDNSAPYEPGSPLPPDGASDQPVHLVLQWSGGDPDGDPMHYDVYLGTSSSPALVSGNQSGRNFTPAALDHATEYFWRIVAEDDHDHSTEGSIWSFTTTAIPVAPAGFSIEADSAGDGVVLRWDGMGGIDSFVLVLPDSSIVSLNGSDTSYADDTPSRTGTYSLHAACDTLLSPPAMVSSAPFASASSVALYTSGGVGGFGWDTDSGEGEAYLLDTGNRSVVDFYLVEDSLLLYLRSCDQPPYLGYKTTGILDRGATSFFSAPQAGYEGDQPVVPGDYYAMRVEGNYYAKVLVASSDSSTVTFDYWFQTVQSLRIF